MYQHQHNHMTFIKTLRKICCTLIILSSHMVETTAIIRIHVRALYVYSFLHILPRRIRTLPVGLVPGTDELVAGSGTKGCV